MSNKFREYGDRITVLTIEVERLNGLLKNKVDENQYLENQIRSYEQ